MLVFYILKINQNWIRLNPVLFILNNNFLLKNTSIQLT
ncbi:hypothetical protein LACWKB10_0162 [Lactobacillus sp. wkB10]|nr:hypothetical protein LACWKB10_0162 [Lactobacillus sp. wkB10]